jgi:hypothetical protein
MGIRDLNFKEQSMKKINLFFYLVGTIVFFLITNNTNIFNDFKEVAPVQNLELNSSVEVARPDLLLHENKVLENLSYIEIIPLVVFSIVVFALFRERNKIKNEVNNKEVRQEYPDDNINYLGRFCVDFKITIEDLQELVKKKSI